MNATQHRDELGCSGRVRNYAMPNTFTSRPKDIKCILFVLHNQQQTFKVVVLCSGDTRLNVYYIIVSSTDGK